ncbi:MAG TPA: tyrosine-type recombinase/integrase [Thermoanaerobaculia bacterium]|jgi:integrase
MKFTERSLNALPRGSATSTWYADDGLPGLCVVAYPSGARVFVVRYRSGSARRVVRLGRHGTLSLEQARAKARELLSRALLGSDLASERERARNMPTFGAWIATYLERIAVEKKSPREDRKFLPRAARHWRDLPLDQITVEHVEAFRLTMKATPTTSNRCLASVRSCLSSAVRAGHLRFNPAKGLKLYREAPPRARTLDADEMTRLLAAIEAEPDRRARVALRLLVDSGARLTEALRARPEDFDPESGTWRIPSPKAGRPQTIPLAASTLAMVRMLFRPGAYLFPARLRPDQPRRDLRGPWESVKARAGLRDVRIHDLRRTFGLAIARASGLHIASKLLRHADIRVTERVYAPLGLEELREAVEKRTARLA